MEKILIIDDDELFRDTIAMVLEESDYEVLEASEGAQGIEMARTHAPALILCDLRMRGMDGYEALRVLRTDPRTAGIPLVLMTGMTDDESLVEGRRLGAVACLTKPFSIDTLLEAVDGCLVG